MKFANSLLAALVLIAVLATQAIGQLQQSGNTVVLGAGSALIGKVGFDQTTPGTTNAVSLAQIGATTVATGNGVVSAGVQRVAIASDNTAFSVNATLAAGTFNLGLVRAIPSSCTQSTNFSANAVQVATGAGSTITATTTCVTLIYANNITNSAVTLRVTDGQGTPVVWVGGNGDFIIGANSNVRFPLDGVTFTSGVTAIAGTASAINLQVTGLQ
jgi:hypothetical protein